MPALSVTEATFEREVLRAELPVLIDFHADWSQPSKQQSLIVEEVARELDGQLKVVRINVDQNPRIAQSFQVQAVPQLFVVHQGEVAAAWDRGPADKKTILKLVSPFLPRAANEIKPAELAALIREQRVLPVDVREPAVFARYHIPTAINVPAAELETRAMELQPRDGRVRILYGRANDEGKDLAERLMKAGLQVGFLAGGFLHWEADGLPVERGARPS